MDKKKNVLKYIYNILWDNSDNLKLILPISEIRNLNEIYKNNFMKYNNFYDFINDFKDEFSLLKLSKSAYLEVEKQFLAQKGLQTCILTECFIVQTIANAIGLDKFVDLDTSTSTPIEITNLLYSFAGFRDKSSFRYLYFNSSYNIVLIQCGDSSTIDAVFVKDKFSIRIEFKEELSKLQEIDIRDVYGEDGKLIMSEKFKAKYPAYVPFINLFNDNTNIFEMIGHNFKISDFLTEKNCNDIFDSVFNNKVIDLYIMLSGDYLHPILSNYLYDNVCLDNSEIRTAGRNKRKLFCPEYAKKCINELGGTIVDNVVTIPYDEHNLAKGRGINIITRYKISQILLVQYENIKVIGNKVIFDFNDIYQLVPSISIHLKTKYNKASCLEQSLVLNSK